jgi:glycosyltransferase involved in cell wall biosynthesis
VRIAIFDYKIKQNNPCGGCHLRVLRALAREHEFTVFSVEFDNPCPERIKWVRVPVPQRPLALLFLSYHLLAPILYWLYRLRTNTRFDVVQMVESKLSFGAISYVHFCHTAYLKFHWSGTRARGMRGLLRWADHRLHALLEKRTYQSAKQILVPSRGLARELEQEFPAVSHKMRVLPNAVDTKRLKRPLSFNREKFRSKLDIRADDVVFAFVALGQFERKGLPLLLEALARLNSQRVKLLVVGGEPDLIETYRKFAKAIGVDDRVVFVGMRADIRPYLWGADAFILPSSYETFSLVAFEAASSSLPLLIPPLHGVEEIIADGENGYIFNRSVDDITSCLDRFLALPLESRLAMAERARVAATQYDEQRFVGNWRAFYQDWQSGLIVGAAQPSAQASVGVVP